MDEESFRVLRAQLGDRQALDELLRSVQKPLFRYCLHVTGERAIAEDTLQDVFVIIIRKLQWLNDPALFRTWAYRITTREALRRIQRRRREEPLEEMPAAAPNIDRALIAAELPRLLDRLSPAARAVLTLHYLEDMPLAEVAAVLGIAVGTVKSRLAYGLSRLRTFFEGAESEKRTEGQLFQKRHPAGGAL